MATSLKTNFQIQGGGKGNGLLVDSDAAGLGGGKAFRTVVYRIVAIEEVEDGDADFIIKGAQVKLGIVEGKGHNSCL